MHVFCIFVFAPVQRYCACFTWKGALEMRSLLLLLLFIIVIIIIIIIYYTCSLLLTEKLT